MLRSLQQHITCTCTGLLIFLFAHGLARETIHVPHLLQLTDLSAGDGGVASMPHEDLSNPEADARPAPCDERHLAAQDVRAVEVAVLLQAVVIMPTSSHVSSLH